MSSHQHADEKKKITLFSPKSLKCHFWNPLIVRLGEIDAETVTERKILWADLEKKDSMSMLSAETEPQRAPWNPRESP